MGRTIRRTGLAVALAGALAVRLAAQGDVAIKEEKPGLLKAAKVAGDAARKTALAKYPAGRVVSAELEREGGRLIYSFDIAVPGKKGVEEVHVDAMTGAVVGTEHESAADEAKEKAKPRKPAGP